MSTLRLNRKKVFVGLSGGVDSSVSAALLKEAKYDVAGVFIRVWHEDTELTRNGERGTDAGARLWRDFNFSGCTVADDRLDAMRVCAKLQIPFVELDLEKEYKKEVVDYMIREYRAGKTPNPDVMCNRFIKFGEFYKWAMERGADFIATGHYAKVIEHRTWNMEQKKSNLNVPRYMLHASSDSQKDQSYFLWQIRKEQLSHILFPVGGMKKPDVRKLAEKFGLITADKKDSQGLCFVGKVDMKEFLSHYIKPKKGKILDEKGNKVGEHNGAFFYTLGERLPVFLPSSTPPAGGGASGVVGEERVGGGDGKGAFYVTAKDIRKNTITVSHKAQDHSLPNAVTSVALCACNWLANAKAGKAYTARARYRQPLEKCWFTVFSKDTATVVFQKSQSSITPGQSLVIYDGGVVVGGGIIQ